MTKKEEEKEQAYLEWLVRCRSQNQRTSLMLYKLMTANLARIRKDAKLASIGVSLVAICFNLWRAVFLSDTSDSVTADRIDPAINFLKTLISDNAIAYAQDKNARAWTFLSYLNNARYRLTGVSERTPSVLPNFSVPKGVTSKRLWEYLQTNTDLAVDNYANALKVPPQSN
jgi:hypothetical protein